MRQLTLDNYKLTKSRDHLATFGMRLIVVASTGDLAEFCVKPEFKSIHVKTLNSSKYGYLVLSDEENSLWTFYYYALDTSGSLLRVIMEQEFSNQSVEILEI